MGLIACYKFNGDFKDVTGKYNTSLATGTPKFTQSRFGLALEGIGGTNTHVDTGIVDNASDMSISFWMNNTLGNWDTTAVITGTRLSQTGWMLYRNNNDGPNFYRLYFHYIGTDGLVKSYNAWPLFTGIDVNTWNHFVITRSGDGKMTIWKNNVRIYNFTTPTDFVRWNINTRSLRILEAGNLGLLINDYCIFDHVLTKSEVTDLFEYKLLHLKFNEPGLANDSSSNAIHNGVINGLTFSTESKIGKGSALFTNSSQTYVNYGTDNRFEFEDNSPVSVAAWVKPSSFGSRNIIVSKNYARSSPYIFMFGLVSGQMSVYTEASWKSRGPILPLNEWSHVAWAFDGTTVLFYLNGVQVGTSPLQYLNKINHSFKIGGYASSTDFDGLINEVIVYKSSISQTTVSKLYKTRASISLQSTLNTNSIVETKQNPLTIDWTIWKEGQTGSVGVFTQNGTTTENSRILGLDPWGKEVVVWEAKTDGPSDASGGWGVNSIPIDNTKMYRLSVWINRTVMGNGTTYLGTGSSGGTSGNINRVTGVNDTNAYFFAATPHKANAWVLYVGHIFPVGSGIGPMHPDSGRYEVDGTKLLSQRDYVWNIGAKTSTHRTYLYYATDLSTRQQFLYPRFELCDGTEPSISDLLSGLDSRNYDSYMMSGVKKNTPLAITDQKTKLTIVNEVGVIKGCIGWWKLNNNGFDYVSKLDGVLTDVVFGSGIKNSAASFNSSTSKINISTDTKIIPPAISISCLVKITEFTERQIFIAKWDGYVCGIDVDRKPYFQVQVVTPNTIVSPKGVPMDIGRWYHFVGTYDVVSGCSLYIDGELIGSTPSTAAIAHSNSDLIFGQFTEAIRFIGNLQDIRIFNRVLSQKEIKTLFKYTGLSTILIANPNSVEFTRIVENI